MSGTLILVTGVIYGIVAGDQLAKGNLAMFITYGCYAGAAVGMYMLAK